MDKIIKRFLIVSLWLIVSTFDLHAQADEPENVTFQGAVIRHPSSDKSLEVSGVVQFNYDDQKFIEEPFVILAGNSKVTYSKTMSWDLTDISDNLNYPHDYFTVAVICKTNCEESNIRSYRVIYTSSGTTSEYGPERFGLDERDNAYIVNLTLIPKYFTIGVDVELPNEGVAQEDIPITFLSEDYRRGGGSATSAATLVKTNNHVIKKGQTGGQFNVKFDLEESLSGEYFFLGYQCLSLACESAGLLSEAWLSESQTELFSDAFSAVSIEVRSYFGSSDDDFYFNLPHTLELLNRNNLVEINVFRDSKLTDRDIKGDLIVEKLFYRNFCNAELSPMEYWEEIEYTHNYSCLFPLLVPLREVVSVSEFSFSEGEQNKEVSINMETVKTKTNPSRFGNFEQEPHQTIRFECTSGCENSPNIKSGYLNENGKFSARNISQAKKFYQTEDFYQDELIFNLTRPPLITPMLDLLMEEEASD